MKEYLEDILHMPVGERRYEDTEKLPLACRTAFELNIADIGGQEFLLAEPKEEMNLILLRKTRLRLERYTGYRCAFYLKRVNWYAADKLVEEGIPFVWENRQVYLPFMGLLLKPNEHRTLKNCSGISFITQKLLLKALYENWRDVSAAQVAEKLNVSRMTATRCYDEIEALGMPFLTSKRKSRRFSAAEDKREMWNTILPFLRNPVIRVFRPEKKPAGDMMLAGTSALSEYSMLSEERCATYAVDKARISDLGIKDLREVPLNEEPACVVQETGYTLRFGDYNAVDPLSLTLTLTAEELADPRVGSCVNDMLKELVW